MEERIKSSSRPTSTQANQKRPSSDGGEDCQEIEIVNPIPIVLMVMERSVPARGVVVEPERKSFG
jgi:hypothetical protein